MRNFVNTWTIDRRCSTAIRDTSGRMVASTGGVTDALSEDGGLSKNESNAILISQLPLMLNTILACNEELRTANVANAATKVEIVKELLKQVSENSVHETAWRSIETAPVGKKMFLVKGETPGNSHTAGQPYKTDVYCTWQNSNGDFPRYPHEWGPTHWAPIPE